MNNEAEYEALIASLGLAREMGTNQIRILSDSQVVVNQINGTYQDKDLKMSTYLKKALELKR